MRKRFFYDKAGAYIGASNHSASMEGAAGSTDAAPDHGGQVFDSAAESWGEAAQGEKVTPDPMAAAPAAYVQKVAGYTLRQCEAGLMQAKGIKREVLQARLNELAAGGA